MAFVHFFTDLEHLPYLLRRRLAEYDDDGRFRRKQFFHGGGIFRVLKNLIYGLIILILKMG